MAEANAPVGRIAPPRLGLGIGEASGDLLAAAIVDSLRARSPEIELAGITGSSLECRGVESLAGVDQLNVMGLFEVLRHVPRLARLRRGLGTDFRRRRIDAFVGVDAPDFNLGLARRLKRSGVLSVQVVAPSVWAWRRYRIGRIARSLHLLLTLFPFEPGLFTDSGLDARFIGHPLADEMPLRPDRGAARARLNLPPEATLLALLPGSRGGEIARHARLLRDLVRALSPADDVQPVLLLAREGDRARFAAAAGAAPEEFGLRVIAGQTRDGLIAADLAVAASGTVTLEALLARTPMVVYYQLPAATYALARGLNLVKSRFISLPNVLADAPLVPERIQHDATPATLLADVRAWLTDQAHRDHFAERAEALHEQLARGAADRAAEHILEKLERRRA